MISYPGETDSERKGPAMALNWLQIIVLGILQGAAGVLPLSDSGFLTVARKLMGLPLDGSADAFYGALLQLSVLLSVCLVFRREISGCARALSASRDLQRETRRLNQRLLLLIFTGAIPSLLSLLLKGRVSFIQEHLVYIAALMVLSGFVVFLGDRIGKGSRNLPETTLADGLWMGLAHGLAGIPGLSRTGLVMTVGFLRGLEPEHCFRFSFLLWIPYLAVQAISGLVGSAGSNAFHWPYLGGMAIAFGCSCFCLSALRRAVRRGNTGSFAFALWGAGVIAFVLYLIT